MIPILLIVVFSTNHNLFEGVEIVVLKQNDLVALQLLHKFLV